MIAKLRTAQRVLKEEGIGSILRLLADKARIACARLRHRMSGLSYRAGFRGRKKAGLRILYVSNRFEADQGQTIRYRVHNLREALGGTVETSFEILEYGVYQDDRMVANADLIVLMRLFRSEQTERLLTLAKKVGTPTVFDIDDLIFLPEASGEFCRALDQTDESTQRLYSQMFTDYGEVFSACDYATASTAFIVDLMRNKGKEAFLIQNGLNRTQLALGQQVLSERNAATVPPTIGYLSGSRTHDRDFAVAEPAIRMLMAKRPELRLRVAGYLNTDAIEREFPGRVERAGYMKWQDLIAYGAQNSINIAPLDVSNRFCHAKSELKYFEAAIVGVPTVASPTDTFLRCIRHGENGLLAADAEEWTAAVSSLLDDPELYEKISRNARRDACEKYSPQAIARQALAAYREILSLNGTLPPDFPTAGADDVTAGA